MTATAIRTHEGDTIRTFSAEELMFWWWISTMNYLATKEVANDR